MRLALQVAMYLKLPQRESDYLYSTVSWIQTDPNNTENPCGRECVRTPNGALTAKYKAQWRCWRCHTLKQAYRINKASQAWRSFLIVQVCAWSKPQRLPKPMAGEASQTWCANDQPTIV